ncbi:MAG: ABC transporter permease subunit [Firmicutes bacterium]|jgi:phosphate transport system permease protein|nr:ABC transporter permease subunit [Bacillota bacterium]
MRTRSRRRLAAGAAVYSSIVLTTWLAAGILLLLVGYLVFRGLGPLAKVIKYGVFANSGSALLPIWFRTLYLMAAAALLALPLAMGTGIYLSEYARESRLNAWILGAIDGLAKMPPIIYGLLGWGALAPRLGEGKTALIVLLASAIWLLPQLSTMTYAALQDVPGSFRRDSLALGASRWQTAWRVLIPYARRTLAAKVLEGMARVGGEAAPVIMIAAAWPSSYGQPPTTLPYHLYSSLVGSVGPAASHHFGTALLLILTSICLQGAAVQLRRIDNDLTGSVRDWERGRW